MEEPSTSPFPGSAPASLAADLLKKLPQLEIIELLGQGGMGVVYKARQERLDRLVAVEVLAPETGREPAFAERFAREARALARLNHPHIVNIHDVCDADGIYYLVMEYVDGNNLRKMLRDGRVPPAEAVRVLLQVCEALEFAHEEGVIHRDIKPENILLDRKGRVKIADFGLAKLLGVDTTAAALTRTHQAMGSPHYMAPEQWERPRDVDHRADIYALGVICYELLVGELPLGRFALPSEKASVDRRFDEIILRALAKEPEQRFQSVSEMKAALEPLATTSAAMPPAGNTIENTLVDRTMERPEGLGRLFEQPLGRLIRASMVGAVVVLFVLVMAPPEVKPIVKFGIPVMTILLDFLLQTYAAARLQASPKEAADLLKFVVGIAGLLIALFVFAKPVMRHYYGDNDLQAFASDLLAVQVVLLLLIGWILKALAGPLSWSGLRQALRSATGWQVLVCGLGVVAGFTPWVHWSVTGKFAIFNALYSWIGLSVVGMFLTIALVLLATEAAGRAAFWRPIAVVLGGALICFLAAHYLSLDSSIEQAGGTVSVLEPHFETGTPPLFHTTLRFGLASRLKYEDWNSPFHVAYRPGPYAAYGLGGLLVLLGLVQLTAQRRRSTRALC